MTVIAMAGLGRMWTPELHAGFHVVVPSPACFAPLADLDRLCPLYMANAVTSSLQHTCGT